MHQLKIELWGRVQGVNFRRSLVTFAQNIRLTGYVENQMDGSVLVIAQGEQHPLEELLAWCQKGSLFTKVRAMNFVWTETEKAFKDFKLKSDKPFFIDEAQSLLNLGKEIINWNSVEKVPNHVVIIPDGNRRWAREKGWKPWVGHRKASEYERIKALFDMCKQSGIKYLTFWALSTENWLERDPMEQKVLFEIFRKLIEQMRVDFQKEGIRFRHMGRKDRLPKDIIEKIDIIEEETKNNTFLNIQVCMDYNGRDEIVRAYQKMMTENVQPEQVNEELILKYLDSNGIPDPDFIIRTSGERRTSGIMAYQGVYAELYFTNVYFPDFDEEQFYRAIVDYSNRVRRFGGTSEADLKNVNPDDLIDPEEEATHHAH